MQPFSIPLSDNAVVTGLRTPPLASPPAKDTPLIVAIHGGAYSAHYYDATPSNSALPISNSLQVPCVAINRPGYLETTPLSTPFPNDSTYCQEEGKHLHHSVLPALWKTYAREYGVSSIVILAHSLSVPGTIVAAGLNAQEGEKSYPLSGIVLSGLGTEVNPRTKEAMHPLIDPASPRISIPTAVKDEIMLCGLAPPEVLAQSERLNTTSCYLAEFVDGCGMWLTYWKDRYAKSVRCPVLYNLAAEDRLWVASGENVREFAEAFTGSVRVESGVVRGAPHCMELGRAGRGWYARAFGWAVECGVAFGLE